MKKLTALFLAAPILFASAIAPIPAAVCAAEYIAYDYTEIESDLAKVNIAAYPMNPLGKHRLLDDVGFMEYAYSESSFISGTYYGIYFYVYNPTEKAVSEETGANVVNMAVSYGENGEPTDYANCALKFLDKTANNRFLKFRLDDSAGAYKTARAYAEAHGGTRRYDIASVQLLFKGDDTATDSLSGREGNEGASFTYYCKGYSAGCDEVQSDENTLEITYKKLDTISLDIRSTWYRTDNLTPSAYHTEKRKTLSSVYFAVPNYYMDNYGALQIVKAEWYEYRTSLVLVTDDDDIHAKLKRCAGYSLPYTLEGVNGPVYYDPNIDFYFYDYLGPSDSGEQGLGWNHASKNALDSIQRYDWAIKVDDITKTASGKLLEEYANSYAVGSDVLNVAGRTYNAHLFSETVEEGHTRGYNQKVFDARDESQWLDLKLQDNTSGWDQFWNIFIPGRNKEDWLTKEDIKPIETLTGDRVGVSDYELSNDILVDESELQDLRSYVEQAEEEEKTTFLLRFSLSEYDAETFEFWDDSTGWFESPPNIVGFEDAVYLGFDIIYLGFVKEDAVTIIPVVANPIDIYPSYTPTDSAGRNDSDDNGGFDWLKWVVIAVIIILLLVLLFPILPYILQLLWWLILLPFKGIAWICKQISEAVKRRRAEKPAREAERREKERTKAERRKAKEELKREKERAESERLRRKAEKLRAQTDKKKSRKKTPKRKSSKKAQPKKNAKKSVRKGKGKTRTAKKGTRGGKK